ncbi:PTS system transporter subunit IIBC [Enterococcus hirae]|nr:PTS system transporter subunit IIBC [Enterococcus hirae]
MGSLGTFLYGFLLRLTGAVGLYHTIYPLFWYTSLGGTETVAGSTIAGAQNIFFAQLADPNHTGLFTYVTRFFAGRFATMMFGLPAACYAMYRAIPKKNRKKNGGLYFSGALTSFLTGITEPVEYMFLFVAPWLYVIYAFLDGLSFYFANILNIRVGNSFSGGLIDLLLFGVLQGNDKTNWLKLIPFGLVWALIYFFVFTFSIKKFKIAIPGMVEDADVPSEEVIIKIHHCMKKSMIIIDALGGKNNIESVEACATRLRIAVIDGQIIQKQKNKILEQQLFLKLMGVFKQFLGESRFIQPRD